jgi:hypothetical protein
MLPQEVNGNEGLLLLLARMKGIVSLMKEPRTRGGEAIHLHPFQLRLNKEAVQDYLF